MTWSMGVALVVTIGAIAALIKRYETRLVLLSAGILMALLSLEPMIAFKQFDKSMTNATLIIAICSAMGFASVVSLTKCDVHLVALLTKPLKKLGLMLLPACMLVVSLISIAIPSTSGLVAAVGPTIIPLMVRAGFHPAIAAASVVGSITLAYLSPGVSHNAFIAKLADITIMDFIGRWMPVTVGATWASLVLMVLVCNGFIDGSPETQKALLDKMEGYLNHTQSEEFQKEYGDWSVILRVTLDREPDERILALLSKCPAWAEDYGVKLEIEIGGKPVRIVES